MPILCFLRIRLKNVVLSAKSTILARQFATQSAQSLNFHNYDRSNLGNRDVERFPKHRCQPPNLRRRLNSTVDANQTQVADLLSGPSLFRNR